MKHISQFAIFTRQAGAVRLGLALVLALITIGIIGCPWFENDDDDTNPITPNIPPLPGYELKNFQVIRIEDRTSWCAWVRPSDRFHINLPEPGDYLFTITTQQATFRIVARVYHSGVLIFTLHSNDHLISATAQAGIIHAPATAKAVPVKESDYQPPQIWPVPPYATLFAWPTQYGIGAWDQIFEPDPQARVLTLADTINGVLDVWECPGWQSPTNTLTPTETPAPPVPTKIPGGPTVTPTTTPIVPTVTPTIMPTVTPTTAPTATPTIPYRITSCGWDDQTQRTTLANITPAVAGIELRVEVYDRRSATPETPVETSTYLTNASGIATHDFSLGGCPILYAVWSFVNAAQGTNICTTVDVEPPC